MMRDIVGTRKGSNNGTNTTIATYAETVTVTGIETGTGEVAETATKEGAMTEMPDKIGAKNISARVAETANKLQEEDESRLEEEKATRKHQGNKRATKEIRWKVMRSSTQSKRRTA